ncbi:predicted protein [Thalassiosira pseudonana CCMP1335]|uniref:Uncharacterized protein n=1 Tax=Thalassiosira pseudonana TaxID=35128 RepID=B5YNQ4_THAPS|nr:predicted protein [Thalassiosira pseudonana CCMP1335]ACI64674.1 predicted protein [Thalassiosira pseudonana CCMP1335]
MKFSSAVVVSALAVFVAVVEGQRHVSDYSRPSRLRQLKEDSKAGKDEPVIEVEELSFSMSMPEIVMSVPVVEEEETATATTAVPASTEAALMSETSTVSAATTEALVSSKAAKEDPEEEDIDLDLIVMSMSMSLPEEVSITTTVTPVEVETTLVSSTTEAPLSETTVSAETTASSETTEAAEEEEEAADEEIDVDSVVLSMSMSLSMVTLEEVTIAESKAGKKLPSGRAYRVFPNGGSGKKKIRRV